MTEKLQPFTTHIVPPSQTALLSPKAKSAQLPPPSAKVGPVEEEPYTIKCICGFADDDGNTIYCETCDTWQHIECFYPNNIEEAYAEDFAHSCAECNPRTTLDRQRAHNRQILRRDKINNTQEVPERKPKRPPSKGHKKKTKPHELQLNGHSGSESNPKHPHEPQHKKSKSTHRPSTSISSQPAVKRSPSYAQKNGSTNGHPPSPATTPPDLPNDSELPPYSSGTLSRYNNGCDKATSNSFASLVISNCMSLWLRDHDKLRFETGREYRDVFQKLPPNIDRLQADPVLGERDVQITHDSFIALPYLKASHAIDKDVPIIELNGQIGIQKEYCEDPENRWPELSSPLPFVFFHPMLPLYIDTRKEGSRARYVRRSCRPNALLDTYLSEGAEYHFWLVSDRRIAANEQITIPWDFRLPKLDRVRMLGIPGLGDDEPHNRQEYDPKEADYYQTLGSWLTQILCEYGGCACELGPECAFARFRRNYVTQEHSRPNPAKKKSRKPKTQAISPTSTGHATNSRAPSEGHGEDGENDSGSSRSKPPSRDMTPARQGSFDTMGILTEPTDRDKRKVAMVEDSFRRMEQQQQPPRKKKRPSDGAPSAPSKPKFNKAVGTSSESSGSNGSSERRYVDAGTNRSVSGSPSTSVHQVSSCQQMAALRQPSAFTTSRRSSAGPKPEYRNVSVQTDPTDGEWFSPAREKPKAMPRVVSLSQRLLANRHRQQTDLAERRKSVAVPSPKSVTTGLVKMDIESPQSPHTLDAVSPKTMRDVTSPPVVVATAVDAKMADAPPISPTDTRTMPVIPKQESDGTRVKLLELRVEMPPPSTFAASNDMASSASTSTPGTVVPPTFQSPFSAGSLASPLITSPALNGAGAQPSPVKKKLSLQDYQKSRMNKAAAAAAAAKPLGGTLKPLPIPEEAKSPTTVDVVMADVPPPPAKTAEQ